MFNLPDPPPLRTLELFGGPYDGRTEEVLPELVVPFVYTVTQAKCICNECDRSREGLAAFYQQGEFLSATRVRFDFVGWVPAEPKCQWCGARESECGPVIEGACIQCHDALTSGDINP